MIQALKVVVGTAETVLVAADQQVAEDGINAGGGHFQNAPQAHRHHVIHAVHAQNARLAGDDRAKDHARALLEYLGKLHIQRIPALGQRALVGLCMHVHLRIVLFDVAVQEHRAQKNGERRRQTHHDDVHAHKGQHHQQRGGQKQRRHAGQRHHIRVLIRRQKHAEARHGEKLQRAAHAHGDDQRHNAEVGHLHAVYVHHRHKDGVEDAEQKRDARKHPARCVVKRARRAHHAADGRVVPLGKGLIQRHIRRRGKARLHHFKIGKEFRYRHDEAVDLAAVIQDHQSGRDEAHHHGRHLIHGRG